MGWLTSIGVFRSISNTYPCQSVRFVSPSVGHTFEFLFCQRLWDLTKRTDNIVVADMVAYMVADMEMDMVVDMEVNKLTDKVADMVAGKK